MPPRLLFRAARPIALHYRPRPATPFAWRAGEFAKCATQSQCSRRTYAADSKSDDKDLPKSLDAKGPNTDPLPDISSEAAKTAEIMGVEGPDVEQGTPVQEVKDDAEALANLPKVMRDELTGKAKAPKSTREYSTSAIRRQGLEQRGDAIPRGQEGAEASLMPQYPSPIPEPVPGAKFGMPALPLPPRSNLKDRYDPLVKQVTNLLMRDGKLARAQYWMSYILNHLRSSPPPTYSTTHALLPGAPPASHLPHHPVLYLALAVDSVAPLLKVRSARGAAGGGATLPIPTPLAVRQRRRVAIKWILDAASKKASRGSGKGTFAHRVAEEIVAVVEGRSAVWERRNTIHRTCVQARSNATWKPKKQK
ncbi:ribosomal protein S7 domain-containing protein [Lineolata rhizophorae]|uniref:Small ribosomal subunit protein uS7m n=1 Tax=Lineolata rhizophorae TaxID=578093 RepID=A0A6A6P982_9PEZI|nr:ribosomal protein S7 domain-containing protein [Lineolata rhizophorae]